LPAPLFKKIPTACAVWSPVTKSSQPSPSRSAPSLGLGSWPGGNGVITFGPKVPQPLFFSSRMSCATSFVALMSGEPSRSTSPAKKP
jgi:hypothetical protein